MKMINDFQLYDIVEMKKEHPCSKRTKLFQIVRVGADIKIRCLGCGNYIMLPRESFVTKVRKIVKEEISSEFLAKI